MRLNGGISWQIPSESVSIVPSPSLVGDAFIFGGSRANGGYLWIFMDIYGYLIFMRISPIYVTNVYKNVVAPKQRLPNISSHSHWANSKQLLGEVAHVAIVPGHCSGAGQLRHLHDLLMNAAIHLLLAHVRHVPCKWGSLGSPKKNPNYSGVLLLGLG